jgi:hypothetical protein
MAMPPVRRSNMVRAPVRPKIREEAMRVLKIGGLAIALAVGYCAGHFYTARTFGSMPRPTGDTPWAGYTEHGKLPVYLTVHDATLLISSHLVLRRAVCVVPAPNADIDVREYGEHRVQIGYLVPCLRAIDAMPCAAAGRWIGESNSSDAPHPCRAMFGEQ